MAASNTVAVQLGPRANGTQAVRSYTPSLLQLAADLSEALAESPDLHDDIPLPEGMKLCRPTEKRQFQLELNEAYALRHRRVWGYIGEIKLTNSSFTDTGAQIQMVLFLPFRYGREAEETFNSWMYSRVICFYVSISLVKMCL